MVSKKRLDYGFNGYRAPIIPRAPRSIRRRGSRKNLIEDSRLCAFELLAAVADKLLQESECSASSNVIEAKTQLGIYQDGNEKQKHIIGTPSQSEGVDLGSCVESKLFPESSIREHNNLSNFKGLPQAKNDSALEQISGRSSCNLQKKVDPDKSLEHSETKNSDGNCTSKVESGTEILSADDNQICSLPLISKSSVKDPIDEYVNINRLINSESSVQLPVYRDPISNALMPKHWNSVKVGIRDDDENSFCCNRFSTKIRPFRPQSRIRHRRTRNALTSKYRKVAPRLRGRELYTSERMKSFYKYRKRIYTQDRFQQAPIKKRKLCDRSFAVAYGQETCRDNIFSLPDKELGIANGASTTKGHKIPRDNHVKFNIKSFKVPELYVEVPENASVGSLKKTVMEAVTAIIGSGIKVGVVLQGKKVRDDNRTLQQAGLSENINLDSLNFTLEPSYTHVTPSAATEKFTSTLVHGTDEELPKPTAPLSNDLEISNALADLPLVAKFDDGVSNNGAIRSRQTTESEAIDGSAPDCKAIVPVSPTNGAVLAEVPLDQKPKRSEASQRRTRRPFSVAEVEALVAAVEKLGTGRWRDVKIGAFENAEHRTYVDLKDKWKTLVHTASIAPQQRRGEPVPQELLNRVLSAHSYWSQHQSKQQQQQHENHPVEPPKAGVDAPEAVGA